MSVCSSIEGVNRIGVVANTSLLGYCTVKGPVLLCLERHTQIKPFEQDIFIYTVEIVGKHKLSYLSHGGLTNLVGVFSDALQEVLEVGHGDLLDLLSQPGQVFSHDLTEPVLTYPAGDTAETKSSNWLDQTKVPSDPTSILSFDMTILVEQLENLPNQR